MEILNGQLPSTNSMTALIDLRGGSTTCRWLHDHVALLAAALQSHSDAPGAVGVLCERCAMQVAGMLATWRAGLVYLPLDPSLPPQRLLWTVSDAEPVALLVSAETEALVRGYEGPALFLESGMLLRCRTSSRHAPRAAVPLSAGLPKAPRSPPAL